MSYCTDVICDAEMDASVFCAEHDVAAAAARSFASDCSYSDRAIAVRERVRDNVHLIGESATMRRARPSSFARRFELVVIPVLRGLF